MDVVKLLERSAFVGLQVDPVHVGVVQLLVGQRDVLQLLDHVEVQLVG